MQSELCILVVFTGGTIGSSVSGGVINVAEGVSYELLEAYKIMHVNRLKDVTIVFKTITPLRILSENISPVVWSTLISAIDSELLKHKYDGVIVTHGTDTLAYTAAALGFRYNRSNIPLMLVSSNYPITDHKANGVYNFVGAVEFIIQKIDTGVFVPYRNHLDSLVVHKAFQIASSLQLSDDFISVQNRQYMHLENYKFVGFDRDIKHVPTIEWVIHPVFGSGVLFIRPYPGLSYSNYNLDNVKVVLHDLYHSGSACESTAFGEDKSLSVFVKKCMSRGVRVYLAPAIGSDKMYASLKSIIDAGAIVLWNISIETAYVKLLYAHNGRQENIDLFMSTNTSGEAIN